MKGRPPSRTLGVLYGGLRRATSFWTAVLWLHHIPRSEARPPRDGVLRLSAGTIVSGVVAMIVPVALQGVGHRFEADQPAPFAGFVDFAKRFFVEQWVTFPRFVLSGRYFSNLVGTSPRNDH